LNVEDIEEFEQSAFLNSSVNTLPLPTFLFIWSSSAALWFKGGARPQQVEYGNTVYLKWQQHTTLKPFLHEFDLAQKIS
jgi:hypothetical protein